MAKPGENNMANDSKDTERDTKRDIKRDLARDGWRDFQRDSNLSGGGETDAFMSQLKGQRDSILKEIQRRVDLWNLPTTKEITKRLGQAANYCEAYREIRPALALCSPMLKLVGMWRNGALGAASALDLLMEFSDDLCNLGEEDKEESTVKDLKEESKEKTE